MHGADRFIAIGHDARIDRAPFRAFSPKAGPGKDRPLLEIEPGAGLASFLAFGFCKGSQRDKSLIQKFLKRSNILQFCA